MGNIFSVSVAVDGPIWSGWDCVFWHVNYVHRLPEDMAALQSACGRLREARNDVKRHVDMAEREQLQPLEQVLGWLSRVEALETQVNQLMGDGTGELQQKCLGGCCPRHCRTQYKLGKRVAKRLQDVDELMRAKPQGVVAERLPPPGICEMPNEATVGMGSRLDQVWSRLHEEHVGIVSLYGVGGVGKTTLLTHINNAFFQRAHDFDFVIWATVSRNVILEKIQNDIWEKIGICGEEWKSKSREAKARGIWNVLSKKRFVSLLDDVWERLNLIEVGVPLRNKKNNKIVLTTRSGEVCGEMEADVKIKVQCLTWTESWDLFQMKVGEDTLKLHPDIPKLAEAVARECCGLPLVLTTIARAMACKRTPQEWKYAVKVLQNSASNFPGMADRVLPLLKYSYDSLPTEAARSCFLYCSLYPEDDIISKTDLIGHCVCEGVLDANDDDMEGAENHAFNIIGNLIHACLLEETADNICVKMHDVIRDTALWIACGSGREEDRFLVKAGCGLREAPKVGEWMEPKRISLVNNRIDQLTGSPSCPNLITLFLDYNPLKMMITNDFFRFTPNLRVLSLKYTRFTELPKSVSNLVSLQFLDLSCSKIKELPIELKNLDELKYLLLFEMPQYFSIPKQLILSLLKLQLIQISISPISDRATVQDDLLSDDHEALVKELESLKYVRNVLVPITTASALERLLGSDKLRSCIYILDLQSFSTSSSLNIALFNNVKHLHSLHISYCDLLEDWEIDWAWEGKETIESNYLNSKVHFHSLENVAIVKCRKLKDLTWLVFAPNLKVLEVQRCDQMLEILSGHKCAQFVENGESLSPFATLRELILTNLPLLKCIFWKALPLTCLTTIVIQNCPLLKKLPLNTNSEMGHWIAIYGNKDWWNYIEWEDEAMHNAFHPCFIHVEEELWSAANLDRGFKAIFKGEIPLSKFKVTSSLFLSSYWSYRIN